MTVYNLELTEAESKKLIKMMGFALGALSTVDSIECAREFADMQEFAADVMIKLSKCDFEQQV